jgi:GT2 family glycosyltransferase
VTSPSPQLTVSVVICSYTESRRGWLEEAVASARAQTQPALEIIVSIDHNSALLDWVRVQMPDVIAVASDGPRGLSGARNAGVAAARGDVVAFLDDDAVAAPDWLEHLARPYADAQVLGVGGAIEPRWLAGRPRSFPPEFGWVVGCSYVGQPTGRARVRNMIGANMSLRRDVLARTGGFSSGLGRIGRIPAGCEETELCIRAGRSNAGGHFVHEPAARVSHAVPASRGTWRYFRSRCYAEGVSKAQVAALAGAKDGLASERSYALRTLPTGVARGVADTLQGDPAGLARGAAILGGLVLTASGYGVGTLRTRPGKISRPTRTRKRTRHLP